MFRTILLTVMILPVIVGNSFCQKINFTYDRNGNRLTRSIEVTKMKSVVSFPVSNPKSLKSTVEAKVSSESTEKLQGEDQEISMVIYPNPNKGILKINISNLPLNSTNELKLYDLSGIELLSSRNFESYLEIDISGYKDGIYILRIKINEKITDWKIIKNTADFN